MVCINCTLQMELDISVQTFQCRDLKREKSDMIEYKNQYRKRSNLFLTNVPQHQH